ncbi:MAG: hypothetical protein MUE49_04160 [Rhodospirillales bacterium]|jgi:hypothetical protein|nr:hypothetical protein [Rhodospirillales bacterium]
MRIEDLAALPDTDLRAALADWKRWRNHVRHAPVMRLRRERCEQADAFIAAIERELSLRSPEGRYQHLQRAIAAVRELEGEATVSLSAYRAARRQLDTISQRVQR